MENLILRPIKLGDEKLLDDSSYANLTDTVRRELIAASIEGIKSGKFFKFYILEKDGLAVGFMNFYARSQSVISIAPEITERSRNKGYAFLGERLALKIAKEWGYKIAFASVREDNVASIKLHEKLGFEHVQTYTGDSGRRLMTFLKAL